MVEPVPGTHAHPSRRERRADRSRRRWRRVATGAVAIALLTGFGLVITETVRLGGTERPSLARTVETTTRSVTALPTPSTTLPGRPCRSPLNDEDPLRLWIGGDSLAGALGPALGAISGSTGVVQPRFDSRPSSGLSNRGFFDWPEHAAEEMARLDPEVAVFIIGANDFNVPMNTSTDDSGAPAWKGTYTALIEEMLSTLDPSTRTVVWIGAPAFEDRRNEAIEQLDDLHREVIGRHEANTVYVDAYDLFTDANGEYADALPPLADPNAEPVVVRSGDGVHFTALGAERLAQAVFPLIDAQCKVSAQAVPGVVKATIQTEGSTQVVGGTGRGTAVQTSPPATGPPATSPPAPPPTAPASTTPAAPTTTVPVTTTSDPST